MADKEVSIVVSAKDVAGRVLNDVRTNLIALNQAVELGVKAWRVAIGVGKALADAIASTVGPAAQFRERILEIKSLGVEKSVKAIGDEVQKLSRAFGTQSQATIKAYYDAISAGVKEADVEGFLETASKLATVGVTDIATATDLLTTTMNAYKDVQESTTEDMADFIFATVQAGKTTVPELAGSIGRVAAIAGQAGVTLQETGAAIAEMTKRGISSEEAMTALKSLLSTLLTPSEDVKERMKELGVEVNVATIKEDGFVKTLQKLKPILEDDALRVQIFGQEIRAFLGVQAIASDGGERFAKTTGEIGVSLGNLSEAHKDFTHTLAFQNRRLSETFEQIKVSVGEALEPTIAHFLEQVLNPLLSNTKELISSSKNLEIAIVKTSMAISDSLFELLILLSETKWMKKWEQFWNLYTLQFDVIKIALGGMVEEVKNAWGTIEKEYSEGTLWLISLRDNFREKQRLYLEALIAEQKAEEEGAKKKKELGEAQEDVNEGIKKATVGLTPYQKNLILTAEALEAMYEEYVRIEALMNRLTEAEAEALKIPIKFELPEEGEGPPLMPEDWEERVEAPPGIQAWIDELQRLNEAYYSVEESITKVYDFANTVAYAIEGSLHRAIDAAMEGTFKLSKFMKDLAKSVLSGLLKMLASWLTQWIATRIAASIMEAKIHASKVGKAASETYAGAYAWYAATFPPIAGVMAAAHTGEMLAGQAASFGAGLAAGAVESFHEGGIASNETMAVLLKDEAVLPPDLTKQLRRVLSVPATGEAHEGGVVTEDSGMNVSHTTEVKIDNHFHDTKPTMEFVEGLHDLQIDYVERHGGKLVASHIIKEGVATKGSDL